MKDYSLKKQIALDVEKYLHKILIYNSFSKMLV